MSEILAIPKMDQQLARELVSKGATLLVLDCPLNMQFGVDYVCNNVGPKFKGMKMIPPGVHYVYYSPSASDGTSMSPRAGFFVNLREGEVLVKQFDPAIEALVDHPDAQQAERLALGVKRGEFDVNLGPYALNSYRKWQRLSSMITPKVLHKLEPVGKQIRTVSKLLDHDSRRPEDLLALKRPAAPSAGASTTTPTPSATAASTTTTTSTPDSSAMETDGEGKQDSKEGKAETTDKTETRFAQPISFEPATTAFWSNVPLFGRAKRPVQMDDGKTATKDAEMTAQDDTHAHAPQSTAAKPKSKTPKKETRGTALMDDLGKLSLTDITAAHLDQSHVLQSIIEKEWRGDAVCLLGELQFAFVVFLIGESLEGFEQWKRLVALLCSCGQALAAPAYARFFEQFLEVLQSQLEEAPDDFCIDPLSSQNFLPHCVQALLENSEGVTLSPGLAKKVSELRALMARKFAWDLDSALLDADSEFAPVVADLDPEIAKTLAERGIKVRTQ